MSAELASAAAQQNQCFYACGQGANTDDCTDYDTYADELTEFHFCGSITDGQALCDAMAHCTGLVAYINADIYLFTMVGQFTRVDQNYDIMEEFIDYEKVPGQACTEAADFSLDIGKMYITKMVRVALDYVVAPNVDLKLDVQNADDTDATALADANDPTSSKSRMMLIPCSGTCGKTNPSSHAAVGPSNATDVHILIFFIIQSYEFENSLV
jgi:hypothetical protein